MPALLGIPLSSASKRRTFGVLSAYFRRTILPFWQPQVLGQAFTWIGTLAPSGESPYPRGQRGVARRGIFLPLRVGESSAVGTGTAELAEKRRTGAMPNGKCLRVARQPLGRPFRSEISAPR